MTVSTEVDHNDYTGNGVTTVFPYHFRIFKAADLTVVTVDLNENQAELILGTDYSVTGAGAYQGGNVVLSSALANGWKISIARVLAVTQETDLRNQGKFFAEVHENAFDKLTMLIQQCYGWLRLALCKPSYIANYYDALNNRIRNLRDPAQDQDATTKKYVDSLAGANLNRTLRVPDSFIPALPELAQLEGKIIGIVNGRPVGLLPGDGTATDVLIDLASTEAGKGDSLIGVKQPYTGAKSRTAHDKFAEYLLVTDFEGVDPTGATDSTVGLQNAINTRRPLIWPAAIFKTSAPLIFSNQTLIGAGNFTSGSRGTIIQCTGLYSAFKRDNSGYSGGGLIKGFYIIYQGGKPNDPNGLSRGVDFGESTGSTILGSCYTVVEDVVVRGAYYGFYDLSDAYLMEYRNCVAQDCFLGFRKDGGTTIKYSTCYTVDCYGSWFVSNTHVVTFSNCAYDRTVTDHGLTPFRLESCRGVTINGMQHEAGKINNAGYCDIKILNSTGVVINGLNLSDSTVTPASGEAYLIDVEGSTVDICGFRNDVSVSSGATTYGVLARAGAVVTIRASTIVNWTGATTVPLGTIGTGMIHYDSSVSVNSPVTGNCFKRSGRVGVASFPINNVSIPASGRVDVGTASLAGLNATDILSYSSDFAPLGCIVSPSFSSAGNVSLTIYNMTTTARTFNGTVLVSAARY